MMPNYKENSKKWYSKMMEDPDKHAKILARRRKYWAENKDKFNAKRKLKIKQNQEKHNALRREKYKELKERKKNGDTDQFFITKAKQRFKERIRGLQKVCNCSTPKCIVCGEEDIRILTINHINGDGYKEGRQNKKYGNFALSVTRGNRKTDDLDIRCYNCNILYEYENGKRIPIDWKKLLEEVESEIK